MAAVLQLPGAAATAVLQPSRRGRFPNGVIAIGRGRSIKQRRETESLVAKKIASKLGVIAVFEQQVALCRAEVARLRAQKG